MTTFVLKKYEETSTSPNNDSEQNNTNIEKEEVTIKVEGSISEIVAKALQSVLANKVVMKELADDNKETTSDEKSIVKAVSTEEINLHPLDTFNSINKNDIVFIQNKGFKTSQEEWFLTNISNKTDNVFYSVESLISYISKKLGV